MKYLHQSALALVGLVAAAGVLHMPRAASAQQPSGQIDVHVSAAEDSVQALTGHGIMVSIIREGEVVAQKEYPLRATVRFTVPAGLYDVRLEGDGMVTLLKRGIHAFDGQMTEVIGGPLHAGQGAHVVEYAAGGLPREEVAARLMKLETAVAGLQRGR
jgi:hypothetical protein